MADHLRYDFPDLSAGPVNLGLWGVHAPHSRSLPFFPFPSSVLHSVLCTIPLPRTALLLAFLDVLVLLFAVFPRLASR